LHPAIRAQLLDMLRDALGIIGSQAIPARIGIFADGDSCLTVIEAEHLPTPEDEPAELFSGLRNSATPGDVRIDIEPIPGGTRLAWRFPLNLGRTSLA
jgi:hypothetical protein